MTPKRIAQEASEPTETLIIIRATPAGTWQVLLGFGGDTENPLCCASFATLAVARAAAPGIALRYTDALRVRHRRCRLTCSDWHAVEERPRAGAPLWRWRDSGHALTVDSTPSGCQAA